MEEIVRWAVVSFPDNGGAATVRSSWFKEGTLFWPHKNYTKALKENLAPGKGWTKYDNVRLLITCGKYKSFYCGCEW